MTNESRKILETLRAAVAEVLDKKRRLEQYAVIWKDNRVAFFENNDKKLAVMQNDRKFTP